MLFERLGRDAVLRLVVLYTLGLGLWAMLSFLRLYSVVFAIRCLMCCSLVRWALHGENRGMLSRLAKSQRDSK